MLAKVTPSCAAKQQLLLYVVLPEEPVRRELFRQHCSLDINDGGALQQFPVVSL